MKLLFASAFSGGPLMTEERRLLTTGMPLEDIVSNCCAIRREGTLREFVEKCERQNACKCGGAGNCPDCPNRDR